MGHVTMTIIGGVLAKAYANELIGRSAWFMITPLSDDEFDVTVGSDNKDIFKMTF